MIDLINYENNYNLKSILLGITRNPGSIYGPNPTEKEDPRNVIFVALLDRLLKIKNIDVYIINIHIHTIPDNLLKQTKIFDFNLHKDFIDYCITWQGIICKFDSPFYKEYQYFINKVIPFIMYEHGPLNGTLLFDKEPLSNSIYVNNLQQIVQNNYNEFEYNSYKEYILKNRLSKRPQSNENIPFDIIGKYIFLPIQKIEDFTLLQYSEIGMIEYIKKVHSFCKEKKIPLLIKLHPHAVRAHPTIINLCNNLKQSYNNIHICNGNIYNLCKNALFTATINSGSITDNFVVNSIVYSCGRNMFYKTDSLFYNENVEEGLNYVFNKINNNELNTKKIYDTQNKIIWWFKNNLLHHNYDINDNFSLIQNFLNNYNNINK